jgi:hypothetical protein
VVDRIVGNARKHVTQVRFGVEAIQFRCADQAVNRSSLFTTCI